MGAIADFVGHAAELASLASAFDEAVAAHPSVVWIEGPAGSGKTTLLREALAGLPRGVRDHQGASGRSRT